MAPEQSELNPLAAVLRQVGGHLTRLERAWALVGGLAVAVRAEPRLTRDVDLAVAVAGDREAEGLGLALQGLGYRVLASIEQEVTGRLATIRLLAPGIEEPAVVVDLLFASSGIEAEIVAAATSMEVFPELRVPVATVAHLLALKILARDDRRRPQDYDDLLALLREASEADIAEAKVALHRMAERGYGREKDLLADLENLLAERRSSTWSQRR